MGRIMLLYINSDIYLLENIRRLAKGRISHSIGQGTRLRDQSSSPRKVVDDTEGVHIAYEISLGINQTTKV